MGKVKTMSSTTTRANGRASRRQILDAAAQIASEYGYQGTSISAVSRRSGLPASSIYWHFKNKDDLLTAAINDSYERWSEELGEPHGQNNRLYASLGNFPDFVRLGLMMTLEPTPEDDRSARQRFLEIRQESLLRLSNALIVEYPHLDHAQANTLSAVTLALIDGSFLAALAGEAPQDPKLLSSAIHALATAMTTPVR
jgi:AcrR family transcriptional regulator